MLPSSSDAQGGKGEGTECKKYRPLPPSCTLRSIHMRMLRRYQYLCAAGAPPSWQLADQQGGYPPDHLSLWGVLVKAPDPYQRGSFHLEYTLVPGRMGAFESAFSPPAFAGSRAALMFASMSTSSSRDSGAWGRWDLGRGAGNHGLATRADAWGGHSRRSGHSRRPTHTPPRGPSEVYS